MTCPRCDQALASATKWCPHCGFQQLLPAALGPVKPLSAPLLRGTPTPVAASGSGSTFREVGAVVGILVVTGLVLLAMSIFPGEGDTPPTAGGQSLSDVPATGETEPPADEALVPGLGGEPTLAVDDSSSPSPTTSPSASTSPTPGVTPTSSVTAGVTPSPTTGASASPSAKPSPTAKPSQPAEPREPRKPKPTRGPTQTPTPTPQPSATPEPTPTVVPTQAPTPVPTVSVPAAPSAGEQAAGLKSWLNCGDLVRTVSYPVAVEYWRTQKKPLWLDWNLDGRPCNERGFYPEAAVKAYFG